MKAADIVSGQDYVTGDPANWRAAQQDPRKLISPHGFLSHSFTRVTVDAVNGRVVQASVIDRHPYGAAIDVILGRVLAPAAELENLRRLGEQIVADEKAAARAREVAAEEAIGWARIPVANSMACTRCGVPVADWPGERWNRDRHETYHRELDATRTT